MLSLSQKIRKFRHAIPKSIAMLLVIMGIANIVMPLILTQQNEVSENLTYFSSLIDTIPADMSIAPGDHEVFTSETAEIRVNEQYLTSDKETLKERTLFIDAEEATLTVNGAIYHAKFQKVDVIVREHIIMAIQNMLGQITTSTYISGISKGIFIEIMFVCIVMMLIYFALNRTEKYKAILTKILPIIGMVYSITTILFIVFKIPYLIFFLLAHSIAVFCCILLYWEKYLDKYYLGKTSEYGG